MALPMSVSDFCAAQREGMQAMAGAGVIGLHLVSGPLVGFAIGYGLDVWLDMGPWGGAIGLITGILAGFLNVYRDTRQLLDARAKRPAQPAEIRHER